MATPARTGVLTAAAGFTRAAAWAPDWRRAFAGALAREAEERRFFLWIPVAAMGGVALNLAADREPVLWLPAALTALFGALAVVSRARPVALGLSLALAALFAGFLAMSLRTARSSVRRTWMFMPVASAIFLNSPSSFASVCQLPFTSSSMANSLPSEVMRLSLILPPQSATALDNSWTMPTRSPPTALITICCFIGANSTGWALARVHVRNLW